MNIKVRASQLKEAGIIVIGYRDDEYLRFNKLPEQDRKQYMKYVDRGIENE